MLKMNHIFGFRTSRNLKKLEKKKSVEVSDLGWPSKGQDAMPQVRYGKVLT